MRRPWKLVLGLTLVVLGIAAYVFWPRPIYDYIAGASGVVLDAHGSPIAGVRVTFRSAQVVYEAITPLRSAATTTDEQGRFFFSFISCGKPGGPYRLTFEKEGLEKTGVTGRESGKHRIVMQPAREQPVALPLSARL